MQIDVLSGNTLKLTLNKFDMSDMGIQYECLSEKSEQTKRLLSKVLNTVKLNASVDKNLCLDFSGERLFVEAFPRPDGGCMLYISCLKDSETGEWEPVSIGSPVREDLSFFRFPADSCDCRGESSVKEKRRRRIRPPEYSVVFHATDFGILSSAVKALTSKPLFCGESSGLYVNERYGEYRLIFKTYYIDEVTSMLSEYGEVYRSEKEIAYTDEHFKTLCKDNAVETLLPLL